ncbi:MAG: Gfo/Idh/MocA family oxidoreductase [Phycisphaerae bacterium]|nr:Gfo/Idh/MocA family oxidoreductase [Phycisphaerae bacterium]
MGEAAVSIAVIGLGFMGRTHVGAYRAVTAGGVRGRLVAVADPALEPGSDRVPDSLADPATPGPALDLAGLATFDDARRMLDRARPALVSVCSPTDTHVEVAAAALEAGAHVLLEKPVALDADHIRPLAEAAARTGRLVIPAMCMRFWPGWDWLKARIGDGAHGRLLSLSLTRLGCEPTWSRAFYGNRRRSGGAIIDLHIHDADFVVHCLGMPQRVVTTGRPNHLTTVYRFGAERADLHVTATGAWLSTPGFPFRMRYVAEFERAVADFDLGRDPILLLTHAGVTEPVNLGDGSAYERQAAHAIRCVEAARAGRRLEAPTLEEAARVMRLLAAECESLERGEMVDTASV